MYRTWDLILEVCQHHSVHFIYKNEEHELKIHEKGANLYFDTRFILINKTKNIATYSGFNDWTMADLFDTGPTKEILEVCKDLYPEHVFFPAGDIQPQEQSVVVQYPMVVSAIQRANKSINICYDKFNFTLSYSGRGLYIVHPKYPASPNYEIPDWNYAYFDKRFLEKLYQYMVINHQSLVIQALL